VETTFRVRLPTMGHASSDALAKLRPVVDREGEPDAAESVH
jgi:hypothetical protein